MNARIACLLELGSGFNPEFTGRENIYLNGALLGLSEKEIETRYPKIIDFAEIGEFIDQPLKTYSTGMMLRLAFAVIAHVDAELLVIDEALAVGDVFFNQKCMRFLREFQKSKTIILVSHDTASIQSLCTRSILMKRGEIVSDGDPKIVCEKYLEEFYEATQKVDLPNSFSEYKSPRNFKNSTDQRQQYLNHSNLRNDLRIFSFNHDSSSFGNGKAKIVNSEFLDDWDNHLSWIVGGERVTIAIDILALEDVSRVIVGFFIKDRFGQPLFGDNTFLSSESIVNNFRAGVSYKTSFSFVMPILAAGDYSVTVAVASGTPDDHSQLHWIHDAIIFKSESSRVGTGLIGVPMLEISMTQMSVRS
jgi:lipopolysaccharide transport system ATP-binding protein